MFSIGDYSIEVAKSVSEVLALRNEWQLLPKDPNGDIDFYLAVVESHSEVLRPHVIVLRRRGILQAIVLGRIEVKPLQVALGYKKVSTRPVRFLMLIHGGVLGDDTEGRASVIIESIRRTLRSREADIAWFYGLDRNSAFYRVARAAGSLLTRDLCPTSLGRWRGRLPGSYDELLRRLSPNTRHNLKRYSKRLHQAYGEQLTVRSFRSRADVDTILADTEAVAAQTYHRGLGVGFVNNDETCQLMMLAANRGWLRAYILYIAGQPSAFWNGFLYRRTFFTWTTGYLQDLADFRPGTFLLQKVFEDLCSERAADEIDFGFGDAQYKRDWCDHEELQASFLLFAPTMKGIILNWSRTPLIVATNSARALIARTGALQKLKKVWRERLANQRVVQSGYGSTDS